MTIKRTVTSPDPESQPGQLVGKVLTRSRELGGLAEHVDIAVETERLAALIDGLMTNGVIQPDRMTPALMRTVVEAHLDSSAKI